jgi:hypothetical protein
MYRNNAVRKLYLSDHWLQGILLVFMAQCYGFILFRLHGSAGPFGMTFNSMLDHLVHGQFDVDPEVVGFEGFLRDGRVYSYWGITCALLRLPLLLVHRMDLDITPWSCLVADCLAGMMKIRTVLLVRRYCGPIPNSGWAFGLMLAYLILGGAGVGYLTVSVYQEVIFWAIAFAAIFVYFAVKGLVAGEFTTSTLSWMAFAAGLATLTRVSTGLGLCVAFGLLLIALQLKELRARRALFKRRILIPVAILTVLLIAVGTVNYHRWGNPLTFADYTLYIGNRDYPDRMLRMLRYGLFNPVRTLFGLGYYFLPIWALQGADGRLLFENTQTRLLDSAELPPSSPFLTDLLPIAFIVFLAMALWSKRPSRSGSLPKGGMIARLADHWQSFGIFSPAQVLALAAGLAVPFVLMLTASSMTYRYRMEFYPEIDLLAFLSLYATVSNPALLARFNRIRHWMLAATVVSIVSAFAALLLNKISGPGPSQQYLQQGLVDYYRHSAPQYFPRWIH